MKLYGYFRSSAAYRVRITLALKSVPFISASVNLVAAEQRGVDYLTKNPQGLVPALELDDGRVLTQSGAILDWIEREYPDPPLMPSDNYDAAKARALCDVIACDIHPLNNLRVLSYLQVEFGVTDQAKLDWYRHWLKQGFQTLEHVLEQVLKTQLNTGPFCLGEAVSLVDVYLVPQVYNAHRFELDMSEFPNISGITAHCNQQAAFIAAHPDNQADSPNY